MLKLEKTNFTKSSRIIKLPGVISEIGTKARRTNRIPHSLGIKGKVRKNRITAIDKTRREEKKYFRNVSKRDLFMFLRDLVNILMKKISPKM